MRKIVIIIIASISSITYSQTDPDCDLNKQLSSNSNESKIVEITESDFKTYSNDYELKFQTIANSDSIEKELIKKYDFIIKKKDTLKIECLNKSLYLINIQQDDFKANRNYDIMEVFENNFVVIRETAYEYVGYNLIDLKKKIVFLLPSEPRIQPNKYIYGGNDYYGDWGINIFNMEGEVITSFELNSTNVAEYFINNNISLVF
jgi:hypothetical protein